MQSGFIVPLPPPSLVVAAACFGKFNACSTYLSFVTFGPALVSVVWTVTFFITFSQTSLVEASFSICCTFVNQRRYSALTARFAMGTSFSKLLRSTQEFRLFLTVDISTVLVASILLTTYARGVYTDRISHNSYKLTVRIITLSCVYEGGFEEPRHVVLCVERGLLVACCCYKVIISRNK